jgi:hypothetical protein
MDNRKSNLRALSAKKNLAKEACKKKKKNGKSCKQMR